MRLLFFTNDKMRVMTERSIVGGAVAIPYQDILPPSTQINRVIAYLVSYKPKFEEIAETYSRVSPSNVRLQAPLPRSHYLLFASRHQGRVAFCG